VKPKCFSRTILRKSSRFAWRVGGVVRRPIRQRQFQLPITIMSAPINNPLPLARFYPACCCRPVSSAAVQFSTVELSPTAHLVPAYPARSSHIHHQCQHKLDCLETHADQQHRPSGSVFIWLIQTPRSFNCAFISGECFITQSSFRIHIRHCRRPIVDNGRQLTFHWLANGQSPDGRTLHFLGLEYR